MSKKVPLLFVAGSLCDENLFLPQIKAFESEREIIIGDFSGCNSIEKMAQKILSQAPLEFNLVGLSMGGIISFEIIRQATHRVKKLSLLDTNYKAEPNDKKSLRLQQIKAVEENGFQEVLSLVDNVLYPKYVHADNLNNQNLKKTVLEMTEQAGINEFYNQFQALMTRKDSSETLEQITCSTLIICGEDDQLCPVDLHKYMHSKIINSKLEIIPECGHLSTLEKPQEINKLLSQWLED